MKNIAIKEFSDQLHGTLTAELEIIARENEELIARATKSLVSVRLAINQLKDFVYQYKFSNSKEEITFFKEIKPVFVSQYYYYQKVFSIKINEPLESRESRLAYYFDQLEKMQEFVKEHVEFYSYCLSNSTNLDERYFTRGDNSFKSIELDTRFATGYDLVLANILANRLITEHLQNLISSLDSDIPSSLTWTGTKTGLIEIIYSLHAMGAINNGKADIKQVATSFESFFNISLGNWYRHFQEIRLRKNNRTNFLDQMRENLTKRLDDFE
jgi:hypothetical protein